MSDSNNTNIDPMAQLAYSPDTAPYYLQSANLHNIGAGTPSFWSDPLGGIESGVESAIDTVTKIPAWAATSVISGVNSIYNSAITAGNWLGVTDAQKQDTGQLISSFDSDLGQYYQQHKQLADLTGFIATSFIPGIAGVKLLNAGQAMLKTAVTSGRIGVAFSDATGLTLTAFADGATLAEKAGQALAATQSNFTLMNSGVLKAIAGGAAQATLEGAAFESMVQATMFASPILDQQTTKDIAANIVTGGLLGGAIGGVINAAGTYGTIKKILVEADTAEKPFTVRLSQAGLEKDPAARIIVGQKDLQLTPDAITPRQQTLSTSRIQAINNETRGAFNELASGDSTLGNMLADTQLGMDADATANMVAGLTGVRRAGMVGAKDLGDGKTVGYVKLHGEGTGDITFDPIPENSLTLADKMGSQQEIDAFVRKQGFSIGGTAWQMGSASPDIAEARYIWASKLGKDQMEAIATKQGYPITVSATDIPLQEAALRNGQAVRMFDGVNPPVLLTPDRLKDVIIDNKNNLVNSLRGIPADQAARMANVSVDAIESTPGASMFARQDAQTAYDTLRKSKNLPGDTPDLSYIPKHAAAIYDTSRAATVDGNLASAYVNVKYSQKVIQDAVDNAVAGFAGDNFDRLVHPSADFALHTNRTGAGPGVWTYANGDYNSPAAWAEYTGKVTADITKQTQKNISDIVDSAVLKLRTDQTSAIAFDKFRNILASTSEKYIVNEAGDGLINAKYAKYTQDVQSGAEGVKYPDIQEGAPLTIPYLNQTVGDAMEAHIQANGYLMSQSNNLKRAQGLQESVDPNVVYPYKPDPKSMPYFAFVKDESITGQGMGHTSMIHAATQEQLDQMMQMVRERTGFKVYTKADAEEFYKANAEYDYGQTLHDNYIDSSLQSKGINNQFFPKTDPDAIADEWLRFLNNRATAVSRDMVATKFANEFDQLQGLADQYNKVAGSKYGSFTDQIANQVANPYNDYRKTALAISKLNEYPFLNTMNRLFSDNINGTLQRIFDSFAEGKSVNDLQRVNDALEAAGVNSAYKSAAEVVLANHSAPKPYIQDFIRGANSILQNTFLRLDFLNPIHITGASQVLMGNEIPKALKAVMRADDSTSVVVPGTTDRILAPLKLQAAAFKNFVGDMKPELEQMYRDNGWMPAIRDQIKATMEDLTLQGSESPAILNTKLGTAQQRIQDMLSSFAQKGEKITGNSLAEEFNRFMSADVGRQIAEMGVKNGVMSADDVLPFINTFMNRTHANTLAAQRPLIFQGPIGQALGLFQSYQFNVMQQLFKGVSENGAKDAAMLLGMQGTMFGLNGLPAFDFINQHIIGTASGNTNHTDAYSVLYGNAGKTAGDWLMYGIPSNILQTNIYGRGNINPRQLTVIPTAPQDVVAVSAFAKFAGNIKDTLGKLADGGAVWETILQGLEHNGISRPLAGLAATLQSTVTPNAQAFSTTTKGDISFVNDLFSLSTFARLAGGKPLDEALANDEIQRSTLYKAADKVRMNNATEAFKTSIIGQPGAAPPIDAVNNYLNSYVHNGGDAMNFNKTVMHTMTQVNTPRANAVADALKGPYAMRMKELMGGNVENLDPELVDQLSQ